MIQRHAKLGLAIASDELDEVWVEQIKRLDVPIIGFGPSTPDTEDIIPEHFYSAKSIDQFHKLELEGIFPEFCFHALSYLLPRMLFSEHPDWFRMDEKGCRTSDINCCPSSQEALEYLSDRCARLAAVLPAPASSHRYHLWLDDAHRGGCFCPRCRELSRADQSLLVVNAMLRGLRRTDPDAKLCYLAYHDMLQVPTAVRPEPGIFLEYAPMDREYHRPLNDPASPKNALQFQPLAGLLRVFGRTDSVALDYWMDNSLFSNWTKPPKRFQPDLETAAADGAMYAAMGIEIVTSFACYLGAEYRALYGEPPIDPFLKTMRSVL